MVSVEAVNEVLNTLLPADEGEPKSSVRRAQRVSYAGKIHVATVSGGPETMVTLQDISSRGLSFQWSREIKVGTRFTARMERPDGGTILIACQVVHCRPQESGQFNIGAEFVKIIDRGVATPTAA